MKAITHTDFITALLSNTNLTEKAHLKFIFNKSDMALYENTDGSGMAYVKLETITPKMKEQFGDDFVISVYITNLQLYGPKESDRQLLVIDTKTSKTRSGRDFYKVAFVPYAKPQEQEHQELTLTLTGLKNYVENELQLIKQRLNNLEDEI